MNYHILSYAIYTAMTLALTVWVAKTLFNNGRIFLVDIFHGSEQLADSVNKLLIVGFYLINIGYAIYTLKIIGDVQNIQAVIETLSIKLGGIILILGSMHFFNLFVFFRLRIRAKNDAVVRG
ncbi:hypothetical protein BFP72_07585 [Reichenbachiella sp. 5M10]|uniref:hypothetical protein n=1 Tax=Reichenbachiella sp. 5M10 TaxID=1889772 RepID=UPI000C161C35|nr:hypothetical protein [Reichenbachiella sp. 5M10]PIB35268.1 hypothetical protein BFP72_07585 [Reichenbachiella sp. 5M10]